MLSDTKLNQLMGNSAFTALETRMKQYPQGEQISKNINALRPWVVLIMVIALQEADMTHENGVDSLIYKQSNLLNKPTAHLETHTEAVMYFALLPDDLVIAILNEWVQTPLKKMPMIGAKSFKLMNRVILNKSLHYTKKIGCLIQHLL